MAETVALVGLAASIYSLLKAGHGITTNLSRAIRARHTLEGWSSEATILLSLLDELHLDSSTPEGQALLRCREELATMQTDLHTRLASCGPGRLHKIRNRMESIIAERRMDGKLAIKRNIIESLATRDMLQEIRCLPESFRNILENVRDAKLPTNRVCVEITHDIHVLDRIGLELRDQGKLREAEDIHCTALSISVRILGSAHPETLLAMNNLGLCLQDRGKHDAAHSLLVQALEGRQRCFESEHPAVLNSICNVAVSLQLQNRLDDAKRMHCICLRGRWKVHGKNHPETLKSRGNLAIIAHLMKDTVRAETIFRRIARKSETVLGIANPETIRAFLNLARCLTAQRKYNAAETVILQILTAAQKMHGTSHWQTLMILQSHSIILHGQRRLDESRLLAERVRDAKISQFGPCDPRTQFSVEHVQQLHKELRSRLNESNQSDTVFSGTAMFPQVHKT